VSHSVSLKPPERGFSLVAASVGGIEYNSKRANSQINVLLDYAAPIFFMEN
jgi:hypothetical protein